MGDVMFWKYTQRMAHTLVWNGLAANYWHSIQGLSAWFLLEDK